MSYCCTRLSDKHLCDIRVATLSHLSSQSEPRLDVCVCVHILERVFAAEQLKFVGANIKNERRERK